MKRSLHFPKYRKRSIFQFQFKLSNNQARSNETNHLIPSPQNDYTWEDEKKFTEIFQGSHFAFHKKSRVFQSALDKFLAAVGGWGPITTRVRWPYRSIHIKRYQKRGKGQEAYPRIYR